MSLILNSENFDKEVLQAKELVLVDFWASWCGPCQNMLPIVDALSEANEGKDVKICKCNVDENSEIAGKYEIMSIPAFLIFKNGQVVDQHSGGMTQEKLQEMIDKNK